MTLEVTRGVTAAGGDQAAARREIGKMKPRLLEAFAKLAATGMFKVKWWNRIAKLVNKILGVEIMPKSSESMRHFPDVRDLYKYHAVAVHNKDDHSHSVNFDPAWFLGHQTGYEIYWGQINIGMDLKEQTAEPGQRRRSVDLNVTADARQANRAFRITHYLASMQMDVVTLRGMPKVHNAILLMFVNRDDHRDNLENHAGGSLAYIKDTDTKIGGDLEVTYKEVSFKSAFEGSSTEKKSRWWTARNQLAWLKINGFIRGNWTARGSREAFPLKVLGFLRRHDRLARMVVGRVLRITLFGTTGAGGLMASPEDPDEIPWNAGAVANMFDGGRWLTREVLCALMDSAQDAHEVMVKPLVKNAVALALEGCEENLESKAEWVCLDILVNDFASLPLVEVDSKCGLMCLFIGGGPSDFFVGDVVTHVNSENITSLETSRQIEGQVSIRVRRVLDDSARKNLRLSIADANPGPLSGDKVLC